jgi:hypothetical protein
VRKENIFFPVEKALEQEPSTSKNDKPLPIYRKERNYSIRHQENTKNRQTLALMGMQTITSFYTQQFVELIGNYLIE